MRSTGTLLCLGSAAGFGAMAVFGKLAYDEGATVGTLLAVRFALAAALFWALVLARRRRPPSSARSAAATSRIALALGAVRLRAQAGCFFAALERIDASLLSLLLYTFPAMVAVAAIALGRERVDARAARRARARLGRPRAGAGQRRRGRARPGGRGARARRGAHLHAPTSSSARASPGGSARRVLSALVCTGAAVTLTAGSAALGELRPGEVTLAGWGWLAGIAVRLDGRGGEPLLRRPQARRPDRPRRSSPRSSRW